MALTATIYTFNIELADADRGVYETLDLRIACHPSETEEYLVTRLLAYCLEYSEGIEYSKGLSDPEDPTISVRDLTGAPVVGASVGLEVELTWNGFTGVSSTGRAVETDEDGRFELRDVPWRNLRLAVSGAGIDTLGVEITDPTRPIDVSKTG